MDASPSDAPDNGATDDIGVVSSAESQAPASADLRPSMLSVTHALELTSGVEERCLQIRSGIDSVFRQPLQLVGDKRQRGVHIPLNVSAYPSDDSDRFRVAAEPETTEGTTLKNVQFGYFVKGSFRPIGRIDYLVLSDQGTVLEVGTRSPATLEIFKENIFGRELSSIELKRINEVNRAVFDELKIQNADELQAFIKGRSCPITGRPWGKDWADSAGLAYYTPHGFDLLKWAEKDGRFTPEDLYLAGFVERRITAEKVAYANRYEDVAYIPFLDSDGEIVRWRMRAMNPKKGAPKYRDSPLDRAHRVPTDAERQLYQSNLLADVKGNPLILTEGEFKCLVATQMTGIATVGITGISQVTDEIIDALIAAQPSKIVVLFDRDPIGAGYARIDKLTDSERAAYLIARRLNSRGYSNAFVGRLPNALDDEKVGIDDLLLMVGPEAAQQTLNKVIAESLSVSQKEREGGVDPLFHDLYERRQAVRLTLRDFSRHIARDPEFAPGTPKLEEAQLTVDWLTQQFETIDQAYRDYLSLRHSGARRISQPPMSQFTLFGVTQVPDKDRKYLFTSSGTVIPAELFRSDVMTLLTYPKDTPKNLILEETPGIEFPLAMQELSDSYHSGQELSRRAARYFEAGCRALRTPIETDSERETIKSMSFERFVHHTFMGFLSTLYPPGDYKLETHAKLLRSHPTFLEEAASVDVVVLKDGETPVAMASLPVWDPKEKTNDPDRAILAAARNRKAIRAFLRDPKQRLQLEKFQEIVSIVSECGVSPDRHDAAELLRDFGISPKAAQDAGAVVLKRDQYAAVQRRLTSSGLLNQSVQAGLFTTGPDDFVLPRFEGAVILIPNKNKLGQFHGFTVIPLEFPDHISGTLAPEPKLAHTVDSPRSLTRAFRQEGSLFGEDLLDLVAGKTVLVASGELETLQLRSIISELGISDVAAVGVRELGTLTPENCQSLAAARPKRVIFLSREAAHDNNRRTYGKLPLEDADTRAQQFARHSDSSSPPASSMLTPFDLAEQLKRCEDPSRLIKTILSAEPTHANSIQNEYAKAKREFSALLAEVESEVGAALSKLSALPFDPELVLKVLEHQYQRVTELDPSQKLPATLGEFLADRYGVAVTLAADTLFDGPTKSVYKFGREPWSYSGEHWDRHLDRFCAVSGLFPRPEPLPSLAASSSQYDASFPQSASGQQIGDRFLLAIKLLGGAENISVDRNEGRKIPLLNRTIFQREIVVVVDGSAHTITSWGGSSASASKNAVRELEQLMHSGDGELAARLARVASKFGELVAGEREASRINAKGKLITAVSRLSRAEQGIRLEEEGPNQLEDGRLRTRYVLYRGEEKFVGSFASGTTAKASEHLAALALLEKLKSVGVYDHEAEHPAKKKTASAGPGTERSAQGSPFMDPIAALNHRLNDLSRNYPIERGERVYEEQPRAPEDRRWKLTWEIKVSGISLGTVDVVSGSKKSCNHQASAVQLTRLEDVVPTLPEPEKPEKAPDYRNLLERKARELRQTHGPEAVGKLKKSCTTLEDGRFEATYELEILGAPHQRSGIGTSKTLARSQAAQGLLEDLEGFRIGV